MWKIKAPDAVKEKIMQLVSEESVATPCSDQMDDGSDYILLYDADARILLKLGKEHFEKVPEYNPEGWNPFPQVTPPSSKYCLVYLSGDFENTISVDKYKADLKGWLTYCNKDVLAFRPLNVDPPTSEDLMR
ncbi:hypothetical protein [Parasutterella excrementihominis]|uniref:hypothetical protein n=1 Tax=Parasutterella excrementihominis TaxID=487175 RepID=UPI00242CFCAA|nr:hypothetical protein [Parasutterella excrementihominis]